MSCYHPFVGTFDGEYTDRGKKKYNINGFLSAKDLEELSTTLIFPIKSRFRGDRMGVPVSFLSSGNINKAIKTEKPYKGLYFYNRPLHPGMDDVNKPKSVEVWNDNTEVSIKY